VALVAGVDSSTQSCKVVVCDVDSGAILRDGQAAHPSGTEVHPSAWWEALQLAIERAGGFEDVSAASVAAQQHSMVCLDEDGQVVRPALLWNDTRSAGAAADLVDELGSDAWARAVGSVPTASFTVAKLRWLASNDEENARRVAAVCLPHDWLTWQLGGASGLDALATDRGDASGTGYWSPSEGCYRLDLLKRALGAEVAVPAVLGPAESSGRTPSGVLVGPGTGDNMGAALGMEAGAGDLIVSIGTSGVVSAVSDQATSDTTGFVAGFADATGKHLPLVCTLNAAPVLTAVARMLGVDLETFSRLALSAPSGAGGVVFVPHLDGERTPNLPYASGSLHGLRQGNTTPAHIARAAVEGLLCGLNVGVEALRRVGIEGNRIRLVGGGARSLAICEIAPTIFGLPVLVPSPAEYVAIGAARQAAWSLSGDAAPPAVAPAATTNFDADSNTHVLDRYAEYAATEAHAPGNPAAALVPEPPPA
jgi:xylulokinase